MANEEHLKILRNGAKDWNKWRIDNPGVRPDLSEADLTREYLEGVNLCDSNLCRANISWANLVAANLVRADLVGADLSSAHLSRADLSRAYLSGANLTQADLDTATLNAAGLSSTNLSAADLSRADLKNADLSGAKLYMTNLFAADLSRADIRRTNFIEAFLKGVCLKNCKMAFTIVVNVDLSQAKGLETVSHGGPSYVDIHTIYKSKGEIPEIFLRGTGAPEPFIANLKSIVAATEPIQFYSCFISYSTKDQDFAEHLHANLQSKGVRCWFAPENLKIGDKLRPSFDEAIRLYDKLMVILTESSVKSAWVEKEVETAFEKERKEERTVLFPIRLDDAVLETKQAWAADIRRTRLIGDFRRWKDHDSYKKAFERLLRDLKSEAKAGSPQNK